MIKVVSIGNDGAQHREALERLATGHTAALIGNHCVPVLKWITLRHIRFVVMPLLSLFDMTFQYAYEDIGDFINTLHQMLEVSLLAFSCSRLRTHVAPHAQALEFCHGRLVAHLVTCCQYGPLRAA